uniref:Uncharacterized protein n=1 Tax=Brassica oleracea TaxID=3712 RepID=A0A3P6G7A2_BRAOL|nr:unnamed protein product [Brassica oleracea]
MITAVSWIPKEVTKAKPDDVEPPSKEKIKELIENGTLKKGVMQSGEVAHAKAVAKSFGRPCSKSKLLCLYMMFPIAYSNYLKKISPAQALSNLEEE